MNPAFSVIFFTVSSGTGYGLIAWLGLLVSLDALPINQGHGLISIGISIILISSGLLSSTVHLGHPERAWRAFSQWRSSWLSREGVVAIITFFPIVIFAWYWFAPEDSGFTIEILGLVVAILSMLTVYCTAMIYKSLRTIHQWHNGWTVPNYLLLAAAGGAVWLYSISSSFINISFIWKAGVLILILFAWYLKFRYWKFIDLVASSSTPESATGLGQFGKVSRFENPHTAENYLLKEMGFKIAQKHSLKLRRYAQIFAFILPSMILVVELSFSDFVATNSIGVGFRATASISIFFGLLIERWLFFADAKHVVTLYY